MIHHLLFSVGNVQCALPLKSVRVVLQMVQLGPAETTKPAAAGTVNLHGQIIPVYSVRSFFGMPDRAPQLTDKLIIAEAGDLCIALWVDDTHIIEQGPVPSTPVIKAEITEPLAPGAGLASDGTVLFSDLARFLQPAGFRAIDLVAGRTPQKRQK